MLHTAIDLLQAHAAAAYAAAAMLALLVAAMVLRRRDAARLASAPALVSVNQAISATSEKAAVYTDLQCEADVDARKARAQEMTNNYYDLSTDLYLYGWGEGFHFAPRFKFESFPESLIRHEYQMAHRLQLTGKDVVLDVGCGVGGPARSVARFSGCKVVGLNNNSYQIERGTAMNVRDGLQDRIKFVKGDFMRMPFAPNSFDAAYAVEATCHAPDRVGVYREIFKTLKPGGVFGSYEWVTTDKYDAGNAEHRAIKKGIEVGDSLPDLVPASEVVAALRKAGFIVEEVTDLAPATEVPWTAPFRPSYTVSGFRTTPLGLFCTDVMIHVMEFLRLAPAGTSTMHKHLLTATKTLTAGEVTGIFTPMLFVKARKPATAGKGSGSDAEEEADDVAVRRRPAAGRAGSRTPARR